MNDIENNPITQQTDNTGSSSVPERKSSMAGESLFESFTGLLFGSFNSIQIFLYPGLLLYWLESTSMIYTISDLITSRLHFVPLLIFLLTFVYVMLILLKNEYYLRRNSSDNKQKPKGEFASFVVDIHVKLIVLLVILMVLYMLTIFLKYFYGLSIPLKSILSVGIRLMGMLLIMYYYILHSWIRPWHMKGHNFHACKKRLLAYIRVHPGQFTMSTVFMMGLVFLFSKFYTLMLQYIYMPVLAIIGAMLDIHPHLSLHAFSSVFQALYNVLVITVAVLLSNFFFIPLVWLAGKILDRFHPIR